MEYASFAQRIPVKRHSLRLPVTLMDTLAERARRDGISLNRHLMNVLLESVTTDAR